MDMDCTKVPIIAKDVCRDIGELQSSSFTIPNSVYRRRESRMSGLDLVPFEELVPRSCREQQILRAGSNGGRARFYIGLSIIVIFLFEISMLIIGLLKHLSYAFSWDTAA